MNGKEFKILLDTVADAWRGRDYIRAANLFAEDIRYADPQRYSFQCKRSLLEFFQADEGYPQITSWHVVLFDESQQVGAAEYTFDGTHRYHGIALIRIRNNKITHWREYQHIDRREWSEFISGTLFPSE